MILRLSTLTLTSALAAMLSAADAAPAPASPLTLWYRQPARQWVEALPIGNGRLAAMVFGGTAEERLALNEDTVWSGSPHHNNRAEARAAFPEIRRLLAEGKFREAQALADSQVQPGVGKPNGMSFQPVGNPLPDQPPEDPVSYQ
jgi:alpha-L-fucosidase 2